MPRYIDEQYLIDWCNETYQKQTNIQGKEYVNAFLQAVILCPTADVVPKSDVDMLHHLLKDAWERIEELNKLCGELQKAKAEVAREIFEEIEENILGGHFLKSYEWNEEAYSELKKKYQEGE